MVKAEKAAEVETNTELAEERLLDILVPSNRRHRQQKHRTTVVNPRQR